MVAITGPTAILTNLDEFIKPTVFPLISIPNIESVMEKLKR